MTPTSYLQLLDCFRGLLARQQQAVTAQRRRYEVGLEKLAGTEEQVSGRQRRAAPSGPGTETRVCMVELA